MGYNTETTNFFFFLHQGYVSIAASVLAVQEYTLTYVYIIVKLANKYIGILKNLNIFPRAFWAFYTCVWAGFFIRRAFIILNQCESMQGLIGWPEWPYRLA